MAWRKGSLFFFHFLFTLWLTASFVFLLSRFLPAMYAPKGMQEADTAVYGQADQAAAARVRAEYLRKMGLHLPKFYVSVGLKGELLSAEIETEPHHQEWVQKAVLWHGRKPTELFYRQLLRWQTENTGSSSASSLLHTYLMRWCRSVNWAERNSLALQIKRVLEKTDQKQVSQLSPFWQKLSSSTSPASYYIPALAWNGPKNQYHQWLVSLASGNLGSSLQDYRPVTEKISEAISTSALIGGAGLLIAGILSLFIGVHLVLTNNRPQNYMIRQGLYLLDSIPSFLVAVALLFLYLLAGGSLSSPVPALANHWDHAFSGIFRSSFFLSVATIVLLLLPHLSLLIYQNLQHEASSLYVRTARAKGLSNYRALTRHALANALNPIITLLSEVMIGLVAGILLVEITFSLPGVGTLLTQSILTADYPVLIGITLFLLIFRICVMWLCDLIIAAIDPRIVLA